MEHTKITRIIFPFEIFLLLYPGEIDTTTRQEIKRKKLCERNINMCILVHLRHEWKAVKPTDHK